MIFTKVRLLFSFQLLLPFLTNGRDVLDLMNLHEHVKLKQSLKDVDAKSMAKPMFMLKENAFYKMLVTNRALNLPNVTTECFEDFTLIAAVVMNMTDTVPGFSEVFAQSKTLIK